MSGFNESVTTFNHLVRTLLMVILVGVFGYGAYLGYVYLLKPQIEQSQQTSAELEEARQKLVNAGRDLANIRAQVNVLQQTVNDQQTTIEQQIEELKTLREENEKLELAKRLLRKDHRLARLKILEVGTNSEDGLPFTDVEFVELGEGGERIGEPKQFRLQGDRIYLDSWIVKFNDDYIEQADLLRGTSLCVFKSIYGDQEGPRQAKVLEEVNSRPLAYARGDKMSEFEQQIWADFWEISTNPDKASEMGVRAGHGQANYVKAVPGLIYEVDLRASDGMTIRPVKTETVEPSSDASPAEAGEGETDTSSADAGGED